MKPLTEDAARLIIREVYDQDARGLLVKARINFFEAAYLALLPTKLGIVRQDLLGRRGHVLIPLTAVADVQVTGSRSGQNALRFTTRGVIWQIDRVPKSRWNDLLGHLPQGSEFSGSVPAPQPVAPAPLEPAPPPEVPEPSAPLQIPWLAAPISKPQETTPPPRDPGLTPPPTTLTPPPQSSLPPEPPAPLAPSTLEYHPAEGELDEDDVVEGLPLETEEEPAEAAAPPPPAARPMLRPAKTMTGRAIGPLTPQKTPVGIPPPSAPFPLAKLRPPAAGMKSPAESQAGDIRPPSVPGALDDVKAPPPPPPPGRSHTQDADSSSTPWDAASLEQAGSPLDSAPTPLPEEDQVVRVGSAAEPATPAIAELLSQLESGGDAAPVLRRLFHECQGAGQTDQSLFAAQSLVLLEQAGPLEQQHLAQHRSRRTRTPQKVFSDNTWNRLLPPIAGSEVLLEISEALAPVLFRMTARPRKVYGLGSRSKAADGLVFGRTFNTVRAAMDLDVQFHPLMDRPAGLMFANLAEGKRYQPTLVVGKDMLSGHTELELAFLIARELTYFRAAHLLKVVAPALPQQALLVLSAVALIDPSQQLDEEQAETVRSQQAHLEAAMQPKDRQNLQAAVAHLLAQKDPFDLASWNQAVDLAAVRAGLLLSGDVGGAYAALERLLAGRTEDLATVQAELIRFAVSPQHQKIRRTLGLALS